MIDRIVKESVFPAILTSAYVMAAHLLAMILGTFSRMIFPFSETTPARRRLLHNWRPLPGRMHQGEHPHYVLLYLIDQAVAFMHHDFTGARNAPGAPILWMIGKPGSGLAEQIVHLDGGMRAVDSDVIEDLGAVGFCLGRPADAHDSVTFLAAVARRAANVASTSSFERPRPARIDARPASTLRRKY
jgi:hypothetical protein